MIEVKIKLLYPNSKIPMKKFESDACFDVFLHRVELGITTKRMDIMGDTLEVSETLKFFYGFQTEIPVGYKGVVVPRSSFSKTNLIMQNSPGQIDADFRGEWYNVIRSASGKLFCADDLLQFKQGDRFTQMYFDTVLPAWFRQVDTLSQTDRGEGGFGSTGK